MAGIPVRGWVALALYVVLMATLATPLYEPFENGEDDTWVVLAMLGLAHVGLGAAVGRWWTLLAPVAVTGIVLLTVDTVVALVALVIFMPIAVALAAAGWGAARLMRRRAAPAGLALLGIALIVPAIAVVEAIDRSRSPHVSPEVQAVLVSDETLCGSEARGKRQVEVLLRELERDPDALVTYTYTFSDGAEQETRDITVRELAEERLFGDACSPAARRRIRDALGV